MRAPTPPIVLALVAVLAAPACRSAYYSAMEVAGIHKRDILVDRVEEARDAQSDARQQFVDALEAFRSVQSFDGGDLEVLYDRLRGELESSEERVEDVHARVRAVEQVSNDLFAEWRVETEQISDPQLRERDEALLRETRARYDTLISAMRRAESRMEPVLVRFRDQVLYLKHNLNAQAVASLAGALDGIETDVARLIAEMEASIEEADAFLAGIAPSES